MSKLNTAAQFQPHNRLVELPANRSEIISRIVLPALTGLVVGLVVGLFLATLGALLINATPTPIALASIIGFPAAFGAIMGAGMGLEGVGG